MWALYKLGFKKNKFYQFSKRSIPIVTIKIQPLTRFGLKQNNSAFCG